MSEEVLEPAGEVKVETFSGEPQHEQLAIEYWALDRLLSARWTDNPKTHQDELIQISIGHFDFNDPVEVAVDFDLLVVGHGRCDNLKKMKEAGKTPPRHIRVETDDWYVPTILLRFADINQAYLYALVHNRSNTARLSPEDYDGVKLAQVLGKARAAGQLDLIGFGDEDTIAGAGVGPSGKGAIELPPLPAWDGAVGAFDPSKLPDAPGYQADQVAQSYVVMVTLPSWEDLKEAVRALTCGSRRGLPTDAKFASIEGKQLLDVWKALLLGEGQVEVKTSNAAGAGLSNIAPLPGQIGLDGQVVGAIVPPDMQDPVLTIPGPYGFLPEDFKPWDLQTGQELPKTRKVQAPKPVLPDDFPHEPKWVGGLCAICGGSGFTGTRGAQREKISCTACDGAGDEGTWKKQREEAKLL